MKQNQPGSEQEDISILKLNLQFHYGISSKSCLLNKQTILYPAPLNSTEVFTHAKLKPINAGYLVLIDPGVCTAAPVNNTIREPKSNFLLGTVHCITAMNHIPEQKNITTNNSGKSKLLGHGQNAS
jgi:hypothetical protein